MNLAGRMMKQGRRAATLLAQGPLAEKAIRRMVAFSWSRWVLNVAYSHLTPSQKSLFHLSYAQLFRSGEIQGVSGRWTVSFLKKQVLMPLTDGRLWLDWDTAVSIVGHDLEIKETYAALIKSSQCPALFVDIGANYGTHSLLFLTQGIETLTFEPNSSCHPYFRSTCALNGVQPNLEAVALGATEGRVDLSYPERDTWWGSTDAETRRTLAVNHNLITERVTMRPLDDYLSRIAGKRTLIKIDTEGNEMNVLRGATQTLRSVAPMVLFESFPHGNRSEMFSFFSSRQYDLHTLPWFPGKGDDALRLDQFASSTQTNFIAIPRASH